MCVLNVNLSLLHGMVFWKTPILIVSSKGMLVKSASTSKEPMDRDASWSNNSLLNSNELFILKGPLAMGFKMGTKNFAKLYIAVPMTDNIGLILGNPLANGLCTLLSPARPTTYWV